MCKTTYNVFAAKGLASLIGGQVIDHTSWETPELFKCISVVTFGVSLITVIFYYIFIKEQHEKPQMEARKEVLRKIEEKKRRKAEARLEDGDLENDENNVARKRHQMKKVDSVMEAAKEGYMAGHNNLYPLAMRRQESGLSSNGSEDDLDSGNVNNKHPKFAIGDSSLRHKSIEEEEEEGEEEGTDNTAYDDKE